jgi:hypothetical protein
VTKSITSHKIIAYEKYEAKQQIGNPVTSANTTTTKSVKSHTEASQESHAAKNIKSHEENPLGQKV